MLTGIKIDFAMNNSISKLALSDMIDSERAMMMRNIAGNSWNRQYAESLLAEKAAKCKYSAVAAMFARLADLYEKKPCNGLSRYEWAHACIHALKLAGADHAQSDELLESLLEMNRDINSDEWLRKQLLDYYK